MNSRSLHPRTHFSRTLGKGTIEWLRGDRSHLFLPFSLNRRKATQVGEKPAKDESANVS